MNKEINTIIANLEGCIGMFDYLLTPTESNLLVAYIEELQQENKILKENAEHNDKVVDKVNWENMLLKNQQKEFINYLEDEKNRLARECSHIYEDSLGHTRLVNEDIFDEVNDILQKYKSTIGDDK